MPKVEYGYFCSVHCVLKFLQMLAAGSILILVLYEAAAYGNPVLSTGEEFVCFVCFACLILNFLTMIFEACGLACDCGGCKQLYTYQLYYLIIHLCFVVVSSLELMIANGTANSSKYYHARRCAAAALAYLEVVLYALCLWFGPNEFVRVTKPVPKK